MSYHVYIGKAGSAMLDIPPERIENGSPEFDYAPKTKEKDTLAGKTTSPAGVFDSRSFKFNMYWEYAEDLKDLFPDAYNAPTAPQTHGNLIFGAGGCITLDDMLVIVHDDCETDDAKDIAIPAAKVIGNFNMKVDTDSDKMVEIQVYGQPSASGDLRLGVSNLTQVGRIDPATGSFVAA